MPCKLAQACGTYRPPNENLVFRKSYLLLPDRARGRRLLFFVKCNGFNSIYTDLNSTHSNSVYSHDTIHIQIMQPASENSALPRMVGIRDLEILSH